MVLVIWKESPISVSLSEKSGDKIQMSEFRTIGIWLLFKENRNSVSKSEKVWKLEKGKIRFWNCFNFSGSASWLSLLFWSQWRSPRMVGCQSHHYLQSYCHHQSHHLQSNCHRHRPNSIIIRVQEFRQGGVGKEMLQQSR